MNFMGLLITYESWLRGEDLNLRPLGYEPNELPDCSTPRHDERIIRAAFQRVKQSQTSAAIQTLARETNQEDPKTSKKTLPDE